MENQSTIRMGPACILAILSLFMLASCGGDKSDAEPTAAADDSLVWDESAWDRSNWQ
jgi:hypothetical protein